MIEVLLFSDGERVAEAEADTCEGAVLAARCLWDEATTGLQGQHREALFLVDGKLVRKETTRP